MRVRTALLSAGIACATCLPALAQEPETVELLVKQDGRVLACGRTVEAEEYFRVIGAVEHCRRANAGVSPELVASGDVLLEVDRVARPLPGSGRPRPRPRTRAEGVAQDLERVLRQNGRLVGEASPQ
jgi:hypothetical protein